MQVCQSTKERKRDGERVTEEREVEGEKENSRLVAYNYESTLVHCTVPFNYLHVIST